MHTITLGAIDLSFHEVSAGVFHNILQHWGYEVALIKAPHEAMFALQTEGKVDLLMSAWLPGSHGKYLAPYESKIIKFKPIYTPYCIWAVPEYISAAQVSKVEDLKKPEISAKMPKIIDGIGLRAGISRFSVEMIKAYQLDTNGYEFKSNLPETFYVVVERKILRQEWLVIPLWHPQYLHHLFKLRPLIEDKGLLRGKDHATPLLLNSSAHKLKPEHLRILSNITLGNQAITEMEYAFIKQGKSPYEAAQIWINAKFGTIENFIAQSVP
jgi:glycine betaine/proline transport system substrate-binding protein